MASTRVRVICEAAVILAAVTVAFAAARLGVTQSGPAPIPHKSLTALTVASVDGQVHLTCLKSSEDFATKAAVDGALTIRRMDLPGFRYGLDYGEYFDGLNWRDADLVFRGTLQAANGRQYAYTDTSAESGHTYAYWVSRERDPIPTGPAVVRVRDPYVWWSWDEINRQIESISAEFSDLVEVVPVGQTAQGRELRALVAGPKARALVLIGAIHAGESGPELTLHSLYGILSEHPEVLENVGLTVLPCVNADERERLVKGHAPYLRVNSRGVDLNRNFPADWQPVDHAYGLNTTDPNSATYRGRFPASEPETAAVLRLFSEVKPVAVFSYHHVGVVTWSAFLIPKSVDATYTARCEALNRLYRAAVSPEDARRSPVLVTAACTGGSLPEWIREKFDVPSVDVEGDGSADCVRTLADTATVGDLSRLQVAHAKGILAVLRAFAVDECCAVR